MTMDLNPIHLHALTAKAFGFPRALAHGMYTSARAFSACLNAAPQLKYGSCIPYLPYGRMLH